ncbi:MAG: hypothetical protein MJ192_04370 [Clostridia bacterium]|nr:hypothetical protein [Clostridia bacterium]
MSKHTAKYRHDRIAFITVKNKHRMTVFHRFDAFPPTREQIRAAVIDCSRQGISCLIPELPEGMTPGAGLLDEIRQMYTDLVKVTAEEKTGVQIGVLLDPLLEESYYLSLDPAEADAIGSRSLIRREYYCDPNEKLHIKLHGGTLMSINAYDDENMDMIDLRGYVRDGWLDYTVPNGNWTIEEYICTSEPLWGEKPVHGFNRMSAEASSAFINGLLDSICPGVPGEPGQRLCNLYVTDICFNAPNRRNWDPDFNTHFEELFGFDPAPFYPALYHYIGEKDGHIKSLFMECRAGMLRSGCLSALKKYAENRSMWLIAANKEPKLPACSWLSGDALANEAVSPCAVHEKAYLYGLNSTFLAASAADNYESKFVACELFRDYAKLNTKIIYKDTLNTFGHGANLLMIHAEGTSVFKPSAWDRFMSSLPDTDNRSSYPEFIGRIQSLLRGGVCVNDIAMLYPIYALHDQVYLYESPAGGKFEYPYTPASCNYMTVLNSVSTYCGQNVTLLHPQVFNTRCTIEDGLIRLNTSFQNQCFRIMILPAANMVSLESMRMVRDFYDRGGKVLAVGVLPRFAFEFNAQSLTEDRDPADFMLNDAYGTKNDRELRDIVRHIFGSEAVDPDLIRETFYHANGQGGEAYFISSNRTGTDGTEQTDCINLKNCLQSFHVPFDMYMPNMPRFDGLGAFNAAYNDFTHMGLVDFIPGGGMISHIHKKRDGIDIFYISNTTDQLYDEYVYLRGVFLPSRWDPQTGSTHDVRPHYVRSRGEVYTRVRVTLAEDRAVFLVCLPSDKEEKIRQGADSLPDVTPDLHIQKTREGRFYL